MDIQGDIRLFMTYLVVIICLLLLVYWLSIIVYRLYLIGNKHKQYVTSSELDPRCHSQILFSFETVRNRDLCLVVILLLEVMIVIIFSSADHKFDSLIGNHTNSTFMHCEHSGMLFEQLYTHFVIPLMFVTLFIIIITQLMLLSLLNLYLSVRYFRHTFPRLVVCKYMYSWIFQAFILVACIIPKLQILLLPITTLLMFLNWLNLIISSRKMCRAIQSKMNEIRLFEWDANMFRNHSLNLKQYRIAMRFLISANFVLICILLYLVICYFTFIGSCFIHKVYGNNLMFNLTHLDDIHSIILKFNRWIIFISVLLYVILLFLPSLGIFLYHVANLLYDKCTGKGNMQRINNALFEPLMIRYT